MAGHQRTADTPAGGGRADTPAGGGQGGAMRYATDGHTCLRYGGMEDTEGAPTWRQGRRIYTCLMAGLAMFDQKNVIAATIIIVTAFKICISHRKNGLLNRPCTQVSFSTF